MTVGAAWGIGCKPGQPLVARVGSIDITRGEFLSALSGVSQDYKPYVSSPSGRRQFLDILIREKLLLALARKSGVQKEPRFKAEMSRLETEQEERLREGRDYLLTRYWLEGLRDKGVISVSDDEVDRYRRKYPYEVSMRDILVADAQQAESLLKKIRRGAAFSRLAKAKSLDAATASNGGRMTGALYGEVIPELAHVIFHMKVHELSGPIKTIFGYYLLYKDGQKRPPFDKALKARIRLILEKQKLDAYLETQTKKFPVEVFPDVSLAQ